MKRSTAASCAGDVKRIVAMLLVGTLVTPSIGVAGPLLDSANRIVAQAAAEDPWPGTCETAKADATLDAEDAGGFGGGLAWGLGLGLIGTAIAWGTAGTPEPPAARVAGKDAAYMTCYSPVYRQKAKGKRKKGAVIGGLVGTAAWIVIASAASSGDSY